MTFIDSNVLIDLTRPDGEWADWSTEAVGAASADGRLVINPIVLAEFSVGYASLLVALDYLDRLGIDIVPLDNASAHLAGQAHRAYRRSGGERRAILADFLIGAHAQTLGATLITRDRARFATYFPTLTLITPETHP